MIHEAVSRAKTTLQPLTWTYRLEWKRRDSEKYYVVVHCQSDGGYTAEIQIEIRASNGFYQATKEPIPGMLSWGISTSNEEIRKRISGKRDQGRTGLMKPVIAAIYTVLGLFLKEQKPAGVEIIGGGEKRSKLYQSWTAWQFPGYTSHSYTIGGDYGGGITFTRVGYEDQSGSEYARI